METIIVLGESLTISILVQVCAHLLCIHGGAMEWACVTLGMGWWVACACAILKSVYLGPMIHAVYFVAYVTAVLGAACLIGNMWQYAVARRNAYERQQYKIITVTLAFTLAGVSLMGLRPGLA